MSIDLLNASSIAPKPILENIAHNLNTTSLGVNVTWPFNVPNETATYQLYFIATASGSDIANSGNFNLTLPPGENRTQAEGTVGPYGTHPDSDSPPKASGSGSSSGLSKGAIAGIVVGAICAAVLLVGTLVAALLIRRKRRNVSDAGESDTVRKPELDGSSPKEKRATFDTVTSAEIGPSDKPPNHLRFELPSEPANPPVELPDNEVPAFEMSTGADTSTLPRFEDVVKEEYGNNDMVDSPKENPTGPRHTSISPLEGNQNPARPPHARNMSIGSTQSARPLPSPSFPNSPRPRSLRSFSSSSSRRQPQNFAEALEEIVAEEFRRKGSD